MDRTREVRRSTMAASNGVSRRRHRTSSIRESLEDGIVEMQEKARLRDRVEKKDRDSLNRSKRRRGDKFGQRNHREVEDEGSEESLVDEEEYGPARQLLNNAASFQQNHRKSSPSTRSLRQAAPALKVVAVPRKARTASVKRSHEYWTSSCEDRRASASPRSHSLEAGSPSSSTVSVKQRMKPKEARTILPTPTNSFDVQEDLEIEIAEVLGLMKQSRSSKKEAQEGVSPKACDSNDVNYFSREAKPQCDPSNESKKQKVEAERISVYVEENRSGTSGVKAEAESSEKIDISALKLERSSGFDVESQQMGVAEAVPTSTKFQEETMNKEESSLLMKETDRRNESDSCSKMDVDFRDTTVTNGPSTLQNQCPREEKLKIDLMATPSTPSSPERDSISGQMAYDAKPVGKISDGENQASKKKEPRMDDRIEDKKMDKEDFLKLDMEKPSQTGVRDSNIKLQNQVQSPNKQQKHLLAKASFPNMEKSAQPSSVHLPMVVGGWPSSQQSVGYMSPLRAITPADGSYVPSRAWQPASIIPSQPRPKRCANHYYIARNIQFHQQFMKTNRFLPPGSVSAPLFGVSRPNNLCAVPPVESLSYGNLSQGSFTASNHNSAQDKGANSSEAAQKKQPVLQQPPKPPPAASSNLMAGTNFIFPTSHQPQQQSVASATSQSTPSKSVASSNNASLASHSKSGVSAVSFNYSNSAASEAPYLTVLPNNGYQYPISIPAGTQQATRGTGSAQALPFFNGSFYSSQIFHPSQFQQQQQAHQSTNTSRGSHGGAKVGGNSFLNTNVPQKQQTRKQHSSSHQSHKLDAEKSAYGQSLTVPLQPWNFTIMPNMNQSEKHQISQQNLPHAFAMSFASSSSLSFSSMANGYPIVAAQAAHQSNQKKPEGKTAGGPMNPEDGKKAPVGKSTGQTLVFDNSSRTLSFVSSPISGNWPRPVSASSMPSNAPVSTQSGRTKSMAANTLPVSSIAVKFQNNAPAQPSQWKNSVRNSVPQAPPSSLGGSNSSNLKNIQHQQHGRAQQGQTQISFMVNSPIPSSSQPYSSSLVLGSPTHGGSGNSNSKTNSTSSNRTGSSAPTTTPSQQTENSSAGPGQKSSPVCGRNVPSIISSCPSHLSELKY